MRMVSVMQNYSKYLIDYDKRLDNFGLNFKLEDDTIYAIICYSLDVLLN
ncbi:MAG: hypothetical protein K0R93_1808 [Anaerosolibacter sp.]|jgi:hypothetical protein|nr:hypothetical protein [Anaerosolibacter sp.]MDF2546910.1 hypothetical protein [Anaerosolibacter sp.]